MNAQNPLPPPPLSDKEGEVVQQAIDQWVSAEGPLLPVLHHIQDHLGYIPPCSVERVARQLNLSRAEVHGVVTYYPHFRREKPATWQIMVCQAEACQARGARELTRTIESRTGCPLGQHSPDGQWGLEPVYCLGLCASGPAMAINGCLHARVDHARLDELLPPGNLT